MGGPSQATHAAARQAGGEVVALAPVDATGCLLEGGAARFKCEAVRSSCIAGH